MRSLTPSLLHKKLGNGEGILFVGLRFPQASLCEIIDEQWIDDDNPVALCGKIREERHMVTGSRFHPDDQGWVAIQLKDQFFTALSG